MGGADGAGRGWGSLSFFFKLLFDFICFLLCFVYFFLLENMTQCCEIVSFSRRQVPATLEILLPIFSLSPLAEFQPTDTRRSPPCSPLNLRSVFSERGLPVQKVIQPFRLFRCTAGGFAVRFRALSGQKYNRG